MWKSSRLIISSVHKMNLDAEACIAPERSEVSLQWVEERLQIGCNCSDLMKLNLGMAHVVCAR